MERRGHIAPPATLAVLLTNTVVSKERLDSEAAKTAPPRTARELRNVQPVTAPATQQGESALPMHALHARTILTFQDGTVDSDDGAAVVRVH